MKLSPNPTSDQLLVEVEGNSIKYVEIFDLGGRLLQRTAGINASVAHLSIGGITPQALIVRMRIGDQVVVRQIIKQ